MLAVDAVSCNCFNFPNTDKVLLPPLDATPERRNLQNQQKEMRTILMDKIGIIQMMNIGSQMNLKVLFVYVLVCHCDTYVHVLHVVVDTFLHMIYVYN